MDMNCDIKELCSDLNIDMSTSDKEFMGAVDLVRKKYKISQENFCSIVGISRALYTKVKKGDKGISQDSKIKVVRGLAKVKELSALEESSTRVTIATNSMKGFDKFSIEKEISRDMGVKEVREALWKTVQAKQKIKRSAKYFQPSTEGSVDKITLFTRLTSTTEKMFMKVMERFGVINGNTKYSHNGKYKHGRITEFEHIWQYEGDDCKVHVQYKFFDKKLSEDVRELKVEFNPNKWDISKNEMLVALLPFLSKNPRIKEFDVCKDFYNFSDCNIIMPQELHGSGNGSVKVFSENNAKTIYFGDKNKSINLMIYDKRKEMIRKDNRDIGYNCLRAESRYKLKPSQWVVTKNGKEFVEYRVKLSDIDKVRLPNKIYYCQACNVDEKDFDSSMKSEDKIILKGILGGGTTLYAVKSIDEKVAERIEQHFKNLPIETLCITRSDVIIALNSFVLKYLKAIDKFYNIGEIKELAEVWKLKKFIGNFETIGNFDDWENVLDVDIDNLNNDDDFVLILDRDKNS